MALAALMYYLDSGEGGPLLAGGVRFIRTLIMAILRQLSLHANHDVAVQSKCCCMQTAHLNPHTDAVLIQSTH